MRSFSELGLDPSLVKAVEEQGYEVSTPIQNKSIPPILLGRDVIAAAQTGTGKTASFTLPILQRLMPYANNSVSPAKHPVRCLILTPTRELAVQVHENVDSYGKYLQIRSMVLFGGVSMDFQINQLGSGVEIVVATPGRLLDIEKNKAINFRMLEFLVLDEADRMLDMGFLPDITKIINMLPSRRQTLLFSATYSQEIAQSTKKWLIDPIRVDASPPNTLTKTIDHRFFSVETSAKATCLVRFLESAEEGQMLIFCNTKIGADRLNRKLKRDKFEAAVIHGDRTQVERLKTLEDFKKGKISILVATDIAARGLDIENMPRVINFDVPLSSDDYVHRVGRTGRAGSQGEAITFVSEGDEQNLSAIEKIPNLEVETSPFDLLFSPRHVHSERDRKILPVSAASRTNSSVSLFSEPYKPSSQSRGKVSNKKIRQPTKLGKREVPALLLPPSRKLED